MPDNDRDEGIDLATYFGFTRRLPATNPQVEPKPEEPEAKRLDISPMQAVIMLAQRGRKEILPKLRELLNKSPELWQHYGSLTLQAQETWIKLIAGKDLYLAEGLRLHLDLLRADLAGPHPRALERIMVDRILAAHVQVLCFEAHEAQHPGGRNPKLDQYLLKRQDQAHRQFLSTVKTLATVRQLTARTQTIQVQLVNPPMIHSPAAPIIAGANGDEPVAKVPAAQAEKVTVNGSAKPVNRVNGVNGHHNRIGDILEPAAAN